MSTESSMFDNDNTLPLEVIFKIELKIIIFSLMKRILMMNRVQNGT